MGAMKMPSPHCWDGTPSSAKGGAVEISEYKQETFVQCSLQLWVWSWAWPSAAMAINHPKPGAFPLCWSSTPSCHTWPDMIISVLLPRLQPFPGEGSSVRMSPLTALRVALGSLSSILSTSALWNEGALFPLPQKKLVFLNHGWKVLDHSTLLSTQSSLYHWTL